MKLLTVFILGLCIQVHAHVSAQTVTYSAKNSPIEKVFKEIKKQTGYGFMYSSRILDVAKPVTIEANKTSLKEVLDDVFRDQPFSYEVVDKMVVVKEKKIESKKENAVELSAPPLNIDVTITVLNAEGQPMDGASILIKGNKKGIVTDNQGRATLKNIDKDAVVVISFTGFQNQEIKINNRTSIEARLVASTSELDQVQIIAYGTTSKRLNTGDVTTVTSEDIEKQSVSNPLAALQGRVAGLVVSPTTGAPGSAFRIELRGQNSLASSGGSTARDINSDPLIIIDGIPYAPNNSNLSRLTSVIGSGTTNGGLSPFNSINPSDIESIEVLKDAAATAIYGSRGGNGVILITTKKAKAGVTKVDVNVNFGFSRVTKVPELINTQQYLTVRKEALANDAITATTANSPDLTVWDPNSYTNFPALFIGNSAKTKDANVSLSGGNAQTTFLISSSYHSETTIFPSDRGDQKISFHASLNNDAFNKKLVTTFTVNYTNDKDHLNSSDLIQSILSFEPNYPAFHNPDGSLAWTYNGVALSSNPFGGFDNKSYTATTNNLISNLQISYQLARGLKIKSNLGYNQISTVEQSLNPTTALAPTSTALGSALFGSNVFEGWNIEPQLEYAKSFGLNKFNVLIGSTWQYNDNAGSSLTGTGYANNNQLGSIAAAGSITASSSSYQYKYEAFFGRFSYNYGDKYLVDITARRDGSSRFGPDKQFGNFGAVGAAWIFTKERFAEQAESILSFGKLRGSFGITGTDQIGNYQYLDSWSSTAFTYQNTAGLTPSRLANPDFSWEKNQKTEIGLELGFIKDRIFLNAAYFRNQSGNHLVNYPTPSQTGFTSIVENFPAIIVNSGWEFSLTSKNVVTKNFKWTTSGNISFDKNVLQSFPGIESTAYNAIYVVGQSLDLARGYQYMGVNPATGFFQFKDVDGNGVYNTNDYVNIGNFNPKFFWGIDNSFSYKNLQLDVFLEFKKQYARNFLTNYYNSSVSPGAYFNSNIPVELLDRWQQPGDVATYQKYTTKNTGGSFFANYNSLTVSDASYLRLKTVALNYNLSSNWVKKLHLQSCRIYLQGENLFTITGFKVTDPETQLLNVIPPLRTITAGIQLSL